MKNIAQQLQTHLVMAEGPDRQVLVLLDHRPSETELKDLIPGCKAARVRPLTPGQHDLLLRIVPELVP